MRERKFSKFLSVFIVVVMLMSVIVITVSADAAQVPWSEMSAYAEGSRYAANEGLAAPLQGPNHGSYFIHHRGVINVWDRTGTAWVEVNLGAQYDVTKVELCMFFGTELEVLTSTDGYNFTSQGNYAVHAANAHGDYSTIDWSAAPKTASWIRFVSPTAGDSGFYEIYVYGDNKRTHTANDLIPRNSISVSASSEGTAVGMDDGSGVVIKTVASAAEKANDGDVFRTYWRSSDNGAGTDDWIAYDLGAKYDLTSMIIYYRDSNNYTVDIYTSDDGQNWGKKLKTILLNASEPANKYYNGYAVRDVLDGVNARYIKFQKSSSASGANGDIWELGEVMFFSGNNRTTYTMDGTEILKISPGVIRANKAAESPFGSKVLMLSALYDNKTGEMLSVSANAQTVGDEPECNVDIEIDSIDSGHDYILRTFLWDYSNLTPLSSVGTLEGIDVTPTFDTETLFNKMPQIYEASSVYNDNGVEAFYFEGADYYGKPTRCFAYFGMPQNVTEPVPAVVWLHGGGGTAQASWVRMWNARGYAAISFDMNGTHPDDTRWYSDNVRHEYAGPSNNGYDWDYVNVDEAENKWMYHTVVNTIYAHNILRSKEGIDNDRIGVAGLSWGGISTSTASGVDNRFAFAIPIYCGGFLYESTPLWQKDMQRVKNTWDPSVFFKNSKTPTCWIGSEFDEHGSLHSLTKSYELIKNNAFLSIHPGLTHGHSQPAYVEDVYAFADSIVNGKPSYIKFGEVDKAARRVMLDIPDGVTVSAVDIYTSENKTDTYSNTSSYSHPTTEWTKSDNATLNNSSLSFELPDNTGMYYINITDNFGRVSTSGLIYNY